MDSLAGPARRWVERRATPGLYTRYLRILKVSRLLRAAFWTMMAFFLFWSIPWLPGGLSAEDYNRRLALTLILAGCVFLIGATVLTLREVLRRLEEALVAFNAVYDNTTGLYNRRYFCDRLSLECERAHRQGNPFSVLLFRFEPEAVGRKDNAETTLRLLADALAREARSSDLVAVLGANELAVAAIAIDKNTAHEVGQRLRLAVETVLHERMEIKVARPVQLGISEYPSDGSNAAALLRLARESMGQMEAERESEPERIDTEAA